jgi:hypothetical protein
MNEIHINYLLKINEYTKDTFKGTYSADEVKHLELNSNYIVNLDTRESNGSHWVLLSRHAEGPVSYFCTSGMPPFELNITKLLDQYPIIYYSPEKIQAAPSRSCGLYCVLIAYFIARGLSLRESINVFTGDQFYNEIILLENLKVYFHNELFSF